MAQVGSDFACLFGCGGLPLVTPETVYYLRSFGLMFAAGIVGATPVVKLAGQRLCEKKVGAALELVMMIGLLQICTAYLVDGSFSPFLYFRF
jgi:alginate O-acetyltransferase complex protein AlgI